MSDTELSVKLDAWIDDNTVDGDFIAHPDFVYYKLLELETKIKKLQAENAELKKQSEWISVNDGLPSKDGNYLTYEKGRVHSAEHCVCWFSSKYGFDLIGTTHWIPLPTPPKGE